MTLKKKHKRNHSQRASGERIRKEKNEVKQHGYEDRARRTSKIWSNNEKNREEQSQQQARQEHSQPQALSSPLFTQEREEQAGRRQAYHSLEESLLSSQSLSVGHVRTARPVNEFGSLISNVRENPCRDSENEQIRILLERQKEQILADCGAEIHKHEFQADYDRRCIQKLTGVIESQQVKFIVLIKETNNIDEINNFSINNYWSKIGIFVKLMRRVSMRCKN